VGHSGYEVLADEGLLWAADVATLGNASAPTLMALMTCEANNFALPGFPGLGETLVETAGGGAVAVWGPTGLSENQHAVTLARGYYEALFSKPGVRIGDAIVSSMKAYEKGGAPRYLPALYVLLGDPALRVN
jgi:hypothetical protein